MTAYFGTVLVYLAVMGVVNLAVGVILLAIDPSDWGRVAIAGVFLALSIVCFIGVGVGLGESGDDD